MIQSKQKYFLLIFLNALFISNNGFTQKYFSKEDSIFLKDKITFRKEISSAQKKLPVPQAPNGYAIKLIGSDNLSTIAINGSLFTPLENKTVNLVYKLTRQKDGAAMEIPTQILVLGKYPTQGGNAKPFVIPSLREWQGGNGDFKLSGTSRIIIDTKYKRELMPAAKIFQADLFIITKIKLPIEVGKPVASDIYISLNGNKEELGKEGYYLDINNWVTIKASQYQGAFWATRTILQILEQDAHHDEIPNGICRDYPKYEVRGFMLDVGRKYFTIDYLRDYVKLLSYYKISDFQLHLSDNAFPKHYNNNWDSTYSGFRLENDRYPNLPTKGEFYTKKQFIDLQILAEQYAVNIIPEIDVPAHSLAITKAFPQIASKKYGKDHLDINNPETYTIVENIFKEYLEGPNPVFRNKEVHIGTDEYNKKEAESFRKFTDHFIKYVHSFGKDVRVWGALTHAKGKTPVTNKNVTMNAWYNGYADPREMKRLGYPLISTPDGLLYIVPAAGYYYDYLNLGKLYKDWEPVAVGREVFNMGDPFIRGGMFCVWSDIPKTGFTAQDVTDRVFPALQVLSEKMWSGKDTTISFQEFESNAKNINEDPEINLRGKFFTKDSLVYGGKEFFNTSHLPITIYNEGALLDFNSSNSFANLPLEEIGYNYTISFSIFPETGNNSNAILFQSKHATVYFKQGNTLFLGFSHEGNSYNFGVAIPEDRYSNIAITGDNNSVSLFVNGNLAKKLTRELVPVGNGKDSIWKMHTLFFPLKKIGDETNSFRGKLKNLKVFNVILSNEAIMKLKEN